MSSRLRWTSVGSEAVPCYQAHLAGVRLVLTCYCGRWGWTMQHGLDPLAATTRAAATREALAGVRRFARALLAELPEEGDHE